MRISNDSSSTIYLISTVITEKSLILFNQAIIQRTTYNQWLNQRTRLKTIRNCPVTSLFQIGISNKIWIKCRVISHCQYLSRRRIHCYRNSRIRIPLRARFLKLFLYYRLDVTINSQKDTVTVFCRDSLSFYS